MEKEGRSETGVGNRQAHRLTRSAIVSNLCSSLYDVLHQALSASVFVCCLSWYTSHWIAALWTVNLSCIWKEFIDSLVFHEQLHRAHKTLFVRLNGYLSGSSSAESKPATLIELALIMVCCLVVNHLLLYSHRNRWMVWSFELDLQCPLWITGRWSTAFLAWFPVTWVTFFLLCQQIRGLVRKRDGEREREKKKTAVHARRHTAASDQRDCFLWGC